MLKARKRLSKRQIKEDPLVTKYYQVRQFFRDHQKEVNVVLGIAVVVIVIGILMIRSKKNAEIEANAKLGIAESYYHANDDNNSLSDLESISETYPGTFSAGIAVYFLANSYYEKNDYTNAKKYFEIYLDDYSNSDVFISSSLAGVAACLEEEDEFNKAAEFYYNAVKKFPHLYTSPYLLMNAIRCFRMANEIQKSKELCNYLIKKYPNSEAKTDADYLLKIL